MSGKNILPSTSIGNPAQTLDDVVDDDGTIFAGDFTSFLPSERFAEFI
jgi:hypothetical protein